MESYLHPGHFDLITPDGQVANWNLSSPSQGDAEILIKDISPRFVGFDIDSSQIYFNLKSTLAQLGINSKVLSLELQPAQRQASVHLRLSSIDPLGAQMLAFIEEGSYIGKLFAADERRRVRNPEYLSRMFLRADRWGDPLLSLGGAHGTDHLILKKVDGRTIAFLSLQDGVIEYDPSIAGLLPTIGKALKRKKLSLRQCLSLHQHFVTGKSRTLKEGKTLLVKTLPLHVRTVFAKVADELLPQGFAHTTANILQPDTHASGDIYELFGQSEHEISDIPLEFYTLEPHREHVFFADRDQLQSCLEDDQSIFSAFETAMNPEDHAAVFVVKGEQMLNLQKDDWIVRSPQKYEFPGIEQEERQARMVENYISQQACFPFLEAIEDGLITSQGILLTRFCPSPLLKRMLLSYQVQRQLKGIYFQHPSSSMSDFFSQEDRALLNDLHTFGIPIYWADTTSRRILKYMRKPNKDSGMFVPREQTDTFLKATFIGVYGSNLIEGEFEEELFFLLEGLLALRESSSHPLLQPGTPLALVTGGGPGVMEVGNRVAQKLKILSCANIVDFRSKEEKEFINEQIQNPHIEAKMTYRIDKLVERQAEFDLDLPIFLVGGIGTDFELALEEVNRKVGSKHPTPILLFGGKEYWKQKITYRFQCNRKHGTIAGSEWLSNCLYSIENAKEGLEVYKNFFQGTLRIGPSGPIYDAGFCTAPSES